MNRQKGSYTIVGLVYVIFWLLAGIGYIANIVKLVHHISDPTWTMLEVCRVVGIFAAPLGVVLGYL